VPAPHRLLLAATAAGTVALTVAARPAPRATDATRPAMLAGLYRMEAPERVRPAPRLRMPVTEVTFLRLFPDGRSRLENLAVTDRAGAVAADVQVGAMHRHPWEVQTPSPSGAPAPALARLCLEVAGSVVCQRYERDAVTGDVTLFADATAGSAVLRLERVR